MTNFDQATRIPMIISLPPSRQPHPGGVSEALVEMIDLFPTLVEAAEIPSPPQTLHGASLLPLMKDPGEMAHNMNVSFSQ